MSEQEMLGMGANRVSKQWALFEELAGVTSESFTHAAGICEDHALIRLHPESDEAYTASCGAETTFGVDGPPCPDCIEIENHKFRNNGEQPKGAHCYTCDSQS